MTLLSPSPLIERVARVLFMRVELLVPLGAVGMVSRMLLLYMDGLGWCCA